MRTYTAVRALLLATFGLVATTAWAWDGPGHHLATRMAVQALPPEVPAFFRQEDRPIANVSLDPDLFKLEETPQSRNGEYPEHYFDIEMLDGRTPPETRYKLLELCEKEGINPYRLGLLPYALAEWTQRLAFAFAEHRRWPENEAIRGKCLVYAGLLAHYAQDACQPLHTTIHYDGRVGPDGRSPRSGIHARVDALIQKVQADSADADEGLEVRYYDELLPAILAQLDRSHALVDATYALEPALPDRDSPMPENPQVAAFARERLRATAAFTASLYLTAWRDSARLPLPDFHIRERVQTEAAATQPAATTRPAAR